MTTSAAISRLRVVVPETGLALWPGRAGLDPRAAFVTAALCLLAVGVNGFPFLITDSLRYVGALPGLPYAPTLLNAVNQLPYALLGFWGAAIVGITAAAYTMGRLAVLAPLGHHPWLLGALALPGLLVLYAGTVSTEVWTFVSLGLIAAQVGARRLSLPDLVLVGIGALSHHSMLAIALGGAGLACVLFPRRWLRFALLAAAMLLASLAERAIHAIALGDTPQMRYTYIAGEILSHHPHVLDRYCEARPQARFCTDPYAAFIEAQRSLPENADRIDRTFALMRTQLFIWGPSSFWGHASALPPAERLTLAEAEAAAADLWSYTLRHHFLDLLGMIPAKAAAFVRFDAPGIFAAFDTWHADPRQRAHEATWAPALAGYDGSLQAEGLFLDWRFQRLCTLARDVIVVVGLLAPVVLLVIGTSFTLRLSLLFAGFFVGNFAAVAIASAIVGRFIERALMFPALNCLLLAIVLAGVLAARRRRAGPPGGGTPGSEGAEPRDVSARQGEHRPT